MATINTSAYIVLPASLTEAAYPGLRDAVIEAVDDKLESFDWCGAFDIDEATRDAYEALREEEEEWSDLPEWPEED